MATKEYVNFKKVDIVAESFEAAKAQAPFGIQGNATQAYKNWLSKQTGVVTDSMKKEFMIDYLNKKTKNVEGSGFIIVVEAAVTDKRERPYKKINIKNEDGKRDWDTTFDIVGASGKVYATVTSKDAKKFAKEVAKNEDVTEKEIRVKKSDAEKVVKDLYVNKGLTENVDVLYNKTPRKESQRIAMRFEYTPSKGTKPGQYIAFGIEA